MGTHSQLSWKCLGIDRAGLFLPEMTWYFLIGSGCALTIPPKVGVSSSFCIHAHQHLLCSNPPHYHSFFFNFYFFSDCYSSKYAVCPIICLAFISLKANSVDMVLCKYLCVSSIPG